MIEKKKKNLQKGRFLELADFRVRSGKDGGFQECVRELTPRSIYFRGGDSG
jgi:hypothetical protein